MSKKTIKPGLIGKKIAMTQIFADGGDYYGATVLQVGPCTVTQVKNDASDGYNALQIGFGELEFRRVNRAMRGHFEKKKLRAFRHLKEIRIGDAGGFQVGQQLKVSAFQVGDRVDVTGVSKGKGFQGVIKRHHKAGGPQSHGSTFHRSTGSIGQRTYPGKVFKLMKLPGHMGDDQVTVRNLKILRVDAERNLLVLNGAVPGGENAILLVRSADPEFEKRLKAQEAPKAPEPTPEAPKTDGEAVA
ncbi:MAG: 50S ribosomal protein L3 [Deltaproteobacteria bacterium]|nr:50S ribosomal protein L3 [Deltaproteobacteria bacterium]